MLDGNVWGLYSCIPYKLQVSTLVAKPIAPSAAERHGKPRRAVSSPRLPCVHLLPKVSPDALGNQQDKESPVMYV